MVSLHGVRLYTSSPGKPHASQALPFQRCAPLPCVPASTCQLPLALLTSSDNTLAPPSPPLAACQLCPPLALRYTPSPSTLAQIACGSRGSNASARTVLPAKPTCCQLAPPLLLLNRPLLAEPA